MPPRPHSSWRASFPVFIPMGKGTGMETAIHLASSQWLESWQKKVFCSHLLAQKGLPSSHLSFPHFSYRQNLYSSSLLRQNWVWKYGKHFFTLIVCCLLQHWITAFKSYCEEVSLEFISDFLSSSPPRGNWLPLSVSLTFWSWSFLEVLCPCKIRANCY